MKYTRLLVCCLLFGWILPTMATQGSLGSHLLFPLLHAERFLFSSFSHATKEIADICMQAWLRMSLTKTVCQTLSLMLIDGLTLLYVQLTLLVPMLWNLGPFCTSRQTWNLKLWNNFQFETILNWKLYGDNFVFV